jgi:hypothetical protein
MSIKKFHTLADAEEDLWKDPSDPMLWKQIAALWRFSHRLAPMQFPLGVHKHRSLEEAQEYLLRVTECRPRYTSSVN